MAGDWIKMRVSLLTHPKVTALCKLIESSKAVGKKLATGYGGALREIVTRDVTRDVTVASLFRVWGAANEHTSDGVWHGIELDDLDHVAGIPGFGSMMEAVGWAVVDADMQTVTFPNFLEYNEPAKEGRGTGAAERQRRYREKQRANTTNSDAQRDVTRCATRDVTRDGREEERRSEKSEVINTVAIASPRVFHPPTISEVVAFAQTEQLCIDGREFVNFYASKNWMVGKNKMKDWQAAARGWDSRQRKATVNDRREPLSANQRREQTTADAISLLEQQVAARARAAIAIPFSDD